MTWSRFAVNMRSNLRFLLPSLVLATFFLCRLQLKLAELILSSQWSVTYSPDNFLNPRTRKECALVAMIITSEIDHQKGTMKAWFNTLPKNQTRHVCCVSILRSASTSFHFQESSSSCDLLFVPMIREDQYLTISEKVHLGFSEVSSRYNYKWLLKTDADSFVCFSRVLTFLQNYDPSGVTYLGHAESRNILLEDPTHKWYDPSMTDIVHNSRQPVVSGRGLYHPYMQGAGYILSRGAVDVIHSVLPSLRYSPMEDAMVGSWLLAFNAHRGILNIDLRGSAVDCEIPEHLLMSHSRKGRKALSSCLDTNPGCANISGVPAVDVREISFLVTSNLHEHDISALELYDSIRALFPVNEIVLGDISQSDSILNRLRRRSNDPNLQTHWLKSGSMSRLKNFLVSRATGKYVCVLQDVQRLSWETMMATMLHPVEADEVDVAVGYLVFNPQLKNSSYGFVQYGYKFERKEEWLFKKEIKPALASPQESHRVHGASGFILARRSFLKLNRWRELGPFSDDEFYLRLLRRKSRVRLVNSGVRHGYHHLQTYRVENQRMLRKYAPKICEVISRTKGVWKMQGFNVTLDCHENMFKREYSTVINEF